MPDPRYSAIPEEEKPDSAADEHVKVSSSNPKLHNNVFLGFATCLVSLALILLVVGLVTIRTIQAHDESPVFDDSQWLHSHETRAQGDKYLIGVGKADITG